MQILWYKIVNELAQFYDKLILAYSYNPLFFYSWIFVIGAVIGSFLNVVVFRLFSGESIVFPPSHCNSCKEKIKWYDNIPIFSYFVLLRGRCRNCKEKISIQYPIIEFICAVLFLLIFIKYGFSWQTLFLMYFGASAIIMCATDFKEQVVFDVVSIPLIPIGCFYSGFNIAHNDIVNYVFFNMLIPEHILSSVFAVALAFLFFEGISFIAKPLINHRAFGEGDTVIAMGIGAWFGLKVLILTIVLAFFIQAICSFPIMIYKFYKNNDKASIINFGGLLAAVLIPILSNVFGLMNIWIISFLISITSLLIAIVFVIRILMHLRSHDVTPTLFPFGPALLFGTFTAVAFYPFFMELIKTYFSLIL